MNSWLAKISPPKYLRYLFFIVYSFYRSYKSERNEAPTIAILFLAFIHMIGLFSLVFIFFSNYIFDELGENVGVIIILSIISFVHYFLFFQGNKWRSYIDEFSHLKRKDRRKGAIYLFIYDSLSFCFFLLGNSPNFSLL
ncbi:hypothetical protein [Aquimarina aquimarini]|uniref:hypothetical protein n=1 Tax=Aquimarina aquimarini TaxID=1191734 RepID=UPI000D55C293|nr:hypothetical protein [Aquimarina aquimarini]